MKAMKKQLSILLAVAMVLTVLLIPAVPVQAASVKLNKTAVSVKVGSTVKLSVKSGKVKSVSWSSDNKAIATVKRGKVKGVAVGKTTVRAKCKLYGGKTKVLKCKVYVKSGRYLKNPEPYQTDCSIRSVVMAGKTYTKALQNYWHGSKGEEAYYNLNGNYKTMTFTLGHVDNWSESDENGYIEIFLDGESIAQYTYQAGDLRKSMPPKKYSLDVSDGVILEVFFKNTNGGYALADITFDKGHD